ncbi:hypothetical protein D9619_011149 [Psilocybe cf. subviscida]|uniref:Uncharacterized protein n=1 Tax=Psilocybe cf. subviscida TaxID=2480587 RepID=A0A8H5BJH5_9AGAR|nr:hypothetical protein D9619_011149 [Psilocybe cf. subviscida]
MSGSSHPVQITFLYFGYRYSHSDTLTATLSNATTPCSNPPVPALSGRVALAAPFGSSTASAVVSSLDPNAHITCANDV